MQFSEAQVRQLEKHILSCLVERGAPPSTHQVLMCFVVSLLRGDTVDKERMVQELSVFLREGATQIFSSRFA
jgi:hypothetical protein